MAPTPYTYIQCPCSDRPLADRGDGADEAEALDADSSDEPTFDPRAPRSTFSLYPLEYLLFCEDCQQIRCPRCVTEETVTYFCPNCLFEVPSSNLRSEGNRCTRSCFQCPICTGPCVVSPLQASPDASLLGAENAGGAGQGPFALFCQYCNWSSTEIGIEFERASGIHNQVLKIDNGGRPKLTAREVKERRKENPDEPPVPDELVDRDLQFSNLKTFYHGQLADSAGTASGQDGLGFSSPAQLTRIMSLYTGRGQGRQQGSTDVMREALTTDEGLKAAQLDEAEKVKKLQREGWDATATRDQRTGQLDTVRFQDELRPTSHLLRTKRSKRCSVCRHIISKPENKVTSTRFRIKLSANDKIPNISIRPMVSTVKAVPVTSRPDTSSEEALLTPSKAYQYILTFKNPLFEEINVTLATPNATPGRFSSRVTVLCPQFKVNANLDMWDEAINQDPKEKRRKRADEETGQTEAGRIWESGRNWVSIVLEVVPAEVKGVIREDEDVLEIPMFVRMEWEADAQNELGGGRGDNQSKEKRELAYWCVLGVGRIGQA